MAFDPSYTLVFVFGFCPERLLEQLSFFVPLMRIRTREVRVFQLPLVLAASSNAGQVSRNFNDLDLSLPWNKLSKSVKHCQAVTNVNWRKPRSTWIIIAKKKKSTYVANFWSRNIWNSVIFKVFPRRKLIWTFHHAQVFSSNDIQDDIIRRLQELYLNR